VTMVWMVWTSSRFDLLWHVSFTDEVVSPPTIGCFIYCFCVRSGPGGSFRGLRGSVWLEGPLKMQADGTLMLMDLRIVSMA
jgi:hypothetical protein